MLYLFSNTDDVYIYLYYYDFKLILPILSERYKQYTQSMLMLLNLYLKKWSRISLFTFENKRYIWAEIKL